VHISSIADATPATHCLLINESLNQAFHETFKAASKTPLQKN
jgi:hypothetical protein